VLSLQAGVLATHGQEPRAHLHDELERAFADETRLRIRLKEQFESLRELQDAVEIRSTRERRAAVTRAVEHARTLTHEAIPQSPTLLPR
jgi:hypothetical protein